MNIYLRVFAAILFGLTSFTALAATYSCYCQAVKHSNTSMVLNDYGIIGTYVGTKAAAIDYCEGTCQDQIQSEIYTAETYGGETWTNDNTVCGWTGNNVIGIDYRIRVSISDPYLTGVAINPSAPEYVNEFVCLGEPCPAPSNYALQQFYKVGHQYKNYAFLIKNGYRATTTDYESNPAATHPRCDPYLRDNYECVYHKVQSDVDVCFGTNPAPYTPGAVAPMDYMITAGCPSNANPGATLKDVDSPVPYAGGTYLSNVDQCVFP